MPIEGAKVEIWQCDANGRYLHPRSGGSSRATAASRAMARPPAPPMAPIASAPSSRSPYPGRTPHIHFAISGDGYAPLVTQMYVAGEPLNERDGVLNSIDPAARAGVIVALMPDDTIETGALHGRFDIVIDRSA